jgi:hypothetical protein
MSEELVFRLFVIGACICMAIIPDLVVSVLSLGARKSLPLWSIQLARVLAVFVGIRLLILIIWHI